MKLKKKCPRCSKWKNISAFYGPYKNGTFSSYCKRCNKNYSHKYITDPEKKAARRLTKRLYEHTPERKLKARQYYQKNKERILKQANDWNRRNKERRKILVKKWRANNPDKIHAMKAVQYCVKRGYLIPEPCIVCGSTDNIQAHHTDYSKPVTVEWRCLVHHSETRVKIA